MFHLTGLIALVLLMWKWIGLLLRKNHVLRCWGWLSLLNWIRALKLALLLKVPPRKLKPWFILEVSFSWVALYLYKSTMQYCWYVSACAPSGYLESVDKATKIICRNFDPSFGASPEYLAHQNVASLSLFCRYYLDFYLNCLNWFHFLILEDGLLVILIDCMIFLSPFIDVIKMSMSTVSFLAHLDSVYRMLSFDLWSKWL